MTVRQTGPHFQAIRAWADRNDVTGIFDAIALAFGFTENFTIVADLCRVLAGNDAQAVLSQWADNPYIAELTNLLSAFNHDLEFARDYPGFPHDLSKKDKKKILIKAGADLHNTHFLLELILYPQPSSDSQVLDRARTSLILWLIVQALQRLVEKDCPHDSQVQHVASVLCVPVKFRSNRFGATGLSCFELVVALNLRRILHSSPSSSINRPTRRRLMVSPSSASFF
jgi:GAF domain-containing protein